MSIRNILAAAIAGATFALAHPAFAQPVAGAAPASAGAAAAADRVEGEVRRVDKAGGRITLRHGEIKSLDMPPMTMVFRVKDPALLDAVKPGDKVRFTAQKEGTTIVVTELDPVR